MTTAEELVKRAERGQHRGAQSVWADAVATRVSNPSAERSRPLWLTVAAGALPIGLVAGGILWAASGDDQPDTVVVGDSNEQDTVATLDFDGASWEFLPDPNGVFDDAGLRNELTEGQLENFPSSTLERIKIDSRLVVASVARTADGFIAVGHEEQSQSVVAAVWESPDGVAWSRVPTAEVFGMFVERVGNLPPLGWSMELVAAQNGTIVAIGSKTPSPTAGPLENQAPVVWIKRPGEEWSRLDNALIGGVADVYVHQLLSTPTGFFAIGTDNDGSFDNAKSVLRPIMWRSPDGMEWTQVDLSGLGSESTIAGVAAHGDQIVLVGVTGEFDGDTGEFDGDAAAWISEDAGLTWEQADIPTTQGELPGSRMSFVSYGANGYLALGLYRTEEGFTSGGSAELGIIEISGDLDLALWSSTDGRNWSELDTGDINHVDDGEIPSGLTYGSGGFVFSVENIIRRDLVELLAEDQWEFPEVDYNIYRLDGSRNVVAMDHPPIGPITALLATSTGYLASIGDGPGSAMLLLELHE